METYVLAAKNGIVARTGWNVGWQPGQHCPVSQCYEALLKPDARMAYDNFINVTDVRDTARGLLALAAEARPAHQIYHLVSAPEISRVEVAQTLKAESLWGPLMCFEAVPFAAISYSEPRPVRAFLISERLNELGLFFAPPQDVIRRKTAVLDGWRIDAGAEIPSAKNKFFPSSPSSGTIF
jgi:dTDP-4-dehydrorhamnose reductase